MSATAPGGGAVLVTGGAGYVGSFAVRALRASGEDVVVLDDLSEGHAWAVPEGVPLHRVSLRDRAAVREVFRGTRIDAVLHFAASAYVGESVRNPRKYWENNVGCALTLFGACIDHGVSRVVFSSSCTVYGEPEVEGPLGESLPLRPVSPYGRSKAAVEHVLADYERAHGLVSVRLRYFNAAGAALDGSLGEDHEPETHLVPLAIRAARSGEPISVFGTDWPTPDGTCVRDYVHVEDLADAHVAALGYLRGGGGSTALNLGTGTGTSVNAVLEAVGRCSGGPVPTRAAPRRPGDPAALVARPDRALDVLGWTPTRSDIDTVVESAWRWHVRKA